MLICPSNNIHTKLFYLLLITASCYLLILFLYGNFDTILTITPDDAAYFFKTAHNLSTGKGLTFDGINKTNGFQPLWLMVLLPLYYFIQASPETLCRFCLILQLSFLIISCLIIYLLQTDFFSKKTNLITGILFLFSVFLQSANGMESALSVLMFAVLFQFGWKKKIFYCHKPRLELIFGMILGLVVLSRLDTVFLVISICFFCLFKLLTESASRRENIIRFLMIMGGVFIVAGPYLTYNYLNFGNIIPISGQIKSSFPRIILSKEGLLHTLSNKLMLVGKINLIPVTLAVVYLVWFIFKIKILEQYQPNQKYFRLSMAVMASFVIMHFLHNVLFMSWGVFKWHFVSYWLFAAVMLGQPLDYFSNIYFKNKALYWLVAAILFTFGIKKQVAFLTGKRNWHITAYNASIWAQKNTKKTDIFAMSDTGIFGYFSGRRVINLDGVVNNMEYQIMLKNKKLNDYLKTKKVKYFIQHAFPVNDYVNSGNYEVFSTKRWSHKFMVNSEKVLLKKKNEVYRSPPYFNEFNKKITYLVIWRL